MGKNFDMILGGIKLLIGIGVTSLVGGALTLVKPDKLGPITKIGVSLAGIAVSCMAADGVNEYVDKQVRSTVTQIKEDFEKEPEEVV